MAYYSRKFLICICVLQFIATLEWQVFNFLGYMWTPILVCFLQFLFILVGFFGALQYRPRCAVVFVIWLILWIGINVFIICIYLEVGVLRKNSTILNLGLGNKSWWFDHGLGCAVNSSHPGYSSVRGPSSVIPSEREVTGCLLAYPYVEVIHAGIQILLAILAIIASICLAHVLRNEEDTSQPVKSSEMEYINMRRPQLNKPAPLFVPSPSPSQAPLNLNSSQRRPYDSPHEFDTLVTEVDTLSPHASRESLHQTPPQRLSANRLLREASPRLQSSPTTPEPEVPASGSPKRRSGRRQRQRSRRGVSKENRSVSSSYVGTGDGSVDDRSAVSRESHSTRAREPLPWVIAAPLSNGVSPVQRQESGRSSEAVPPYQPPPYSSHPPSVVAPPSPALYVPPNARRNSPMTRLPSHQSYDPVDPWLKAQDESVAPQPPRSTSPYENWPMPAPMPPPRPSHRRSPNPRYENAWSPVPPLMTRQAPPSTTSMTPSSRAGVIFFKSTGGGDGGDQNGLSLGGSVMV